MKIAEVLAVETVATDTQAQSIKQQERALKIRKAQLKVNKAQQALQLARIQKS
jgi:hypothetical protein